MLIIIYIYLVGCILMLGFLVGRFIPLRSGFPIHTYAALSRA